MDIRDILGDENEKPLDRLVADGGFVGIFRTICCIGDSLSSGEFEIIDKSGAKRYLDFYDYSWGQYIGRMAGSKVYNFSRGGMTAREYCENFANANNFWSSDKAANAYIIALGCNDILNRGEPIGEISDIKDDWRENAKTFIGYYADEAETAATIKSTFENEGYLADTHTSVALSCADKYIKESGDTTPMVVASTASPYKFAADVLNSLSGNKPSDDLEALELLSKLTNTEITRPLRGLAERKVNFSEVIDSADMLAKVYEFAK